MTGHTIELRRQIENAKDLHSVVQTMKALAASSIGQYEQSVESVGDYYRTVSLGLTASLRKRSAMASLPAEQQDEQRPLVAVVFGTDQGLAGQFNEKIAEFALEHLRGRGTSLHLWAVGERVESRLADAGLAIRGRFDVPNAVKAIAPLVGRILLANEAQLGQGEHAEMQLFYNQPTSGAVFEPVRQRLLPLDQAWIASLVDTDWPTDNLPEVVGDSRGTLQALVREYLFVSLFRACAESLASENASRLAAMQRADKNIEELLEQLNTSFHRQRQSSIDAELFDLISSFEALE